MAHELKRELITVAGHEDMTSADLIGRFLLRGGETVWVDGPLTRAVREGAQRFVAIELGFPPNDVETEIVAHEAGIDAQTAGALVRLGSAIRGLQGSPLREAASTRLLILAGILVAEGLPPHTAVRSAVVQALSDDPDIVRALGELADAVLQGALLAAGSLDREIVKSLRTRPPLARRYLAVEGYRALAEAAARLPVAAALHGGVDLESSSSTHSLAIAKSRTARRGYPRGGRDTQDSGRHAAPTAGRTVRRLRIRPRLRG